MADVRRGNLNVTTAPDEGEVVEHLVRQGAVAIEQIVSGEVDVPLEFDQDVDEWVTVIEGDATLRVEDDDVAMSTGDWLFLPRHTPHRLLNVVPGTRWLTVTISEPG